MRVTQGMLTQQFLYNLSNINQRIQKDQEESSTGKVLNRPSDNPLAVSQDMAIRSTLSQVSAYQGVITTGLAWMNNTTSTVQSMISTLQSVQTNVNEAVSSTSANASQIGALLKTTQELVKQVYGDVNATQGGNYIFSGTQLTTQATDIASGFQLQSGSNTYYDSPGIGTASAGITQSTSEQPILASLSDPGGLIAPGGTYKLVFDASSIAKNGSIQSGTVKLEAQDGTLIASGSIPSGSTAGSAVTLTEASGASTINLTLGNMYQLNSGASGTLSYQQTDTLVLGAGTSSQLNYEVSQGVNISVNLTAAGLFHQSPDGTKPDLQTTLSQVITDMSAMVNDLSSGSTSGYKSSLASLQTDLGNLQANTNQMINMNAGLGTRIQRMQAMQNQLSTYSQSLTTQKGNLENADMASVLTQYSTDQTVYQSALAIGAKILLPSLINYLPNG